MLHSLSWLWDVLQKPYQNLGPSFPFCSWLCSKSFTQEEKKVFMLSPSSRISLTNGWGCSLTGFCPQWWYLPPLSQYLWTSCLVLSRCQSALPSVVLTKTAVRTQNCPENWLSHLVNGTAVWLDGRVEGSLAAMRGMRRRPLSSEVEGRSLFKQMLVQRLPHQHLTTVWGTLKKIFLEWCFGLCVQIAS